MDIDLYDFPLVAVGVIALFFIVLGVRHLYGSPGLVQSKSTQRFGPFQLFSRRFEEKITNCLSETIDGVDVTTFGYEYTDPAFEDLAADATFRQPVVLFRSNELSLPEFELRPRTPMDKVLFGKRKDIDFDSRPDVSKSYFLRGNDESAIRHVFSSHVLDYFESHKGLSVEGKNERLLCYRSVLDTAVTPDEIKRFLDVGRAVFDLFRMKP